MVLTQEILPSFILTITNFLHIELINNGFIVLHLWSVIHLIAGALILYLVRKEEKPLLLTLLLLMLFECFEFFISYIFPIILKESFLDTFWDLIIGFCGALIVWLILKIKNSK